MQATSLARTFPRGLSAARPWVCASCARSMAPTRARLALPRTTARSMSSPSGPKHQGGSTAPTWTHAAKVYKQRNRTFFNYAVSIILGTVGLAYGSVPFYKMICQTTGWGGQPIKAHSPGDEQEEDYTKRITPVTGARRIRVTFASSVSDVLPWKFIPQQREVRVVPGETALAFYTATNTSDEDIIGIATYSVVPGQVAPYFSKIQCFCFEEQRLTAGESVDMPVFFYIDPDFLKDFNTKDVVTITLNYTFFKARYDKEGHLQPVPMIQG